MFWSLRYLTIFVAWTSTHENVFLHNNVWESRAMCTGVWLSVSLQEYNPARVSSRVLQALCCSWFYLPAADQRRSSQKSWGSRDSGSRSSNEPACGAVFQCRNKQCNHTEHSVVLSEALSGLRSGRGWEGQKGLLVNHRMGVCICAHMRVCACAHMSLFTNPSHSLESGSNEHQGQLRNQKSGTMWATLERGAGLNRTGNTPWAH